LPLRTRTKLWLGSLIVGALYWALRSPVPSQVQVTTPESAVSATDPPGKSQTILEMAKFLEGDGSTLISDPGDSEGLVPGIEWADYSRKRGWSEIERKYDAAFSNSPEDQAIKRILVVQAGQEGGSGNRDEEVIDHAFRELTARPALAVQSLSQSLQSLPLEQSQDRAYLFYLASRVGEEFPETRESLKSLVLSEIHRKDIPPKAGLPIQQFGPVAAFDAYFAMESDPNKRKQVAQELVRSHANLDVIRHVTPLVFPMFEDSETRAPATQAPQNQD